MDILRILAFFIVLSLSDLISIDTQVPAHLALDLSADRPLVSPADPSSASRRIEIGFCHSCKLRDKPVSKLFQTCEHAFCGYCQRASSMSDCHICPECPVCFERNPAMLH